ncbi:MAG: hypothetical protein WCP46_09500, partial [Alphaproteobacteria bacterium]
MGKICKDIKYHNYFNTYSTDFNENFHYISDSLCSFRDKDLVTKIQNKTISNLHLLIHPIWWGNSIEDRDGKVKFVADSKRDYLLNTYYEVVKAYEFK